MALDRRVDPRIKSEDGDDNKGARFLPFA